MCLAQLNPYWCFISGSIYAAAIVVLAVNAPYTKMIDTHSDMYDTRTIIQAKISLVLVIWAICAVLTFVIYTVFTQPFFIDEGVVVQKFDFLTTMTILLSSSLPFLAIGYVSTYLSYVSRAGYAPTFNTLVVLAALIPVYPASMVVNDQNCFLTVDTAVIVISIILMILSIAASIYLVIRLRSIEINEYGELV